MSTSKRTEATALAFQDATFLVSEFRRRALSPVEVAKALLERMQQHDDEIGAMVHVDPDYTLAMARQSESRYATGQPLSALDGIPVTIKDLSGVAGMPRRRGSSVFFEPATATVDAPCVARLREAGTVFLGKTATPEAGCRVVTCSAQHGTTANPYDTSRTPGGSSGGASAALAMGFGPLALGSDGAGSIRIPASHTNVFGLKPGFGRVPAFPPDIDMPHSVVGPMARRVTDAAMMLEVLSRPDPRDPFAWPVPFTMPLDLENPDLRDLRITFSARLGCQAPLSDPEVDALVASAVPHLADAGAEIRYADPVWPIDPLEPFQVFWAISCMATVNGFPADRRAQLDTLLTSVAAQGQNLSVSDLLEAQRQRLAITASAAALFRDTDLLVGPVMPVPPYAVDRAVPEGFDDTDWCWCPYTYIWNMTGQPAASVPMGFTRQGLPVGVQVIGRMGSEADILRASAAIERRLPVYLRRPTLAG